MTNTTNTSAASGAADNCTILPDGSAFAVGSFPLPQDHWLYAPHEYEPGADEPKELLAPILTHAQRNEVVAAVRYAVRGATMCGKDPDFDPDALVQNAVYALCGSFGRTALATTAQATPAAVAGLSKAITASIMRDDGGDHPAFCLMVAYRSQADAESALELLAAAPTTQPSPQQETQEPVAVVVPCHTPSGKRVALYSAKQDLPIGTQLYTAPQPSPVAQGDALDAALLDWLELAGPVSICLVTDRDHDGEVEVSTADVTGYGKTVRAAIDDARKEMS
jgi:hypothetical protein